MVACKGLPLSSFTTACHPSFLVACHPSIAAANHPSHLLAILPLLVIFHYLPSFAATHHLVLISKVVLSQSFSATRDPSTRDRSLLLAIPLLTILLAILLLPAILLGYSRSCANGRLP